MRRSRFAKASEPERGQDRASIGEALWFDIASLNSAEEQSVSAWRVATLEHAALLMGAAHLLVAATFFVLLPEVALEPSLANPVLPALGVLLLDVFAAIALKWRDRFRLSPHSIVRALCVYLAIVGVLWTLFGAAIAGQNQVAASNSVITVMVAGIATAAFASISSPPMSIVTSGKRE